MPLTHLQRMKLTRKRLQLDLDLEVASLMALKWLHRSYVRALPDPLVHLQRVESGMKQGKFETRTVNALEVGSGWANLSPACFTWAHSASGWRQPLPANRASTVCHSGARLKILRLKIHQVRGLEGPKPIHILLKNYLKCNIPKFEHFSSIIPVVYDGSKSSLNFKTMQNRL